MRIHLAYAGKRRMMLVALLPEEVEGALARLRRPGTLLMDGQVVGAVEALPGDDGWAWWYYSDEVLGHA